MNKPVSAGALSPRAIAILRTITALSARRQFAAAEQECLKFTAEFASWPEGWVALGRQRQQRNDLAGAIAAVGKGLEASPQDRALLLLAAELSVQSGQIADGLSRLNALQVVANDDGELLQHIAQLFTRLNLHEQAGRCYRRAAELAPGNPQYLYNLATALIALGKMDEAETLLDLVIAQAPQDYDAYYNRATLRRQTVSRNHVAQIEAALRKPLPMPMGEVQLAYALAKELEDLGKYRRAFTALKRGADARRRALSYRVDDDIKAMSEITSAFDAPFFARETPGDPSTRPIFILGLPRSGTTLVDRILSSHSQVESLGEISDFANALMRAAPAAKNKFELIRQAASSDWAALGKSYCETTAAVAQGAPRTIDKTPINFLYLGLIARALPNATIIHVRRGAMDVCYAMYKTLFRMAYPFSYEQSDLARYYLAYRALMAHWRRVLPGRSIEIGYEDLVADQEAVTRRLLAACGLEWDDAVLAFERNARPSLTASAAQVRQKIYASSVRLWRKYADELAPLAHALRAGGVDIERE
jgi:Flp pilus assembly protein TadD